MFKEREGRTILEGFECDCGPKSNNIRLALGNPKIE